MYFTLFNVSIEEVFMPKFDYSLLNNEKIDQKKSYEFSSNQ